MGEHYVNVHDVYVIIQDEACAWTCMTWAYVTRASMTLTCITWACLNVDVEVEWGRGEASKHDKHDEHDELGELDEHGEHDKHDKHDELGEHDVMMSIKA